ncbi:hypothetical protein PAMP_006402 [Pampus punctatissimus]
MSLMMSSRLSSAWIQKPFIIIWRSVEQYVCKFTTTSTSFLSYLSESCLLCSPQGFVSTVLCVIPTLHAPLLGFMPWFCIFDGALAGEAAGFLCDVCCEITAASPEETSTAHLLADTLFRNRSILSGNCKPSGPEGTSHC